MASILGSAVLNRGCLTENWAINYYPGHKSPSHLRLTNSSAVLELQSKCPRRVDSLGVKKKAHSRCSLHTHYPWVKLFLTTPELLDREIGDHFLQDSGFLLLTLNWNNLSKYGPELAGRFRFLCVQSATAASYLCPLQQWDLNPGQPRLSNPPNVVTHLLKEVS